MLDGPTRHRLGAEFALLRVFDRGLDGDEHLVGATEAEPCVGEHLVHRIGERSREPIPDVRCEHVAQALGDLGDRTDQLGIVENAPNNAGQHREATGGDLDTNGVAHDVFEHVCLVEHHDVVFGQDRAAAGHVQPVQMRVDHDHVGGCRSSPCLFGEARIAERAAIGAGALVAADAHGPPRIVRRRPVEFGHVARLGCARPLGQPLDLDLGLQRHRLEFQLSLIAGAHLAQPLEAHVVAATLEHRPVEVDTQVLGEERQILRGQLILQGLRRGRHDDSGVGLDRRHEVGERLAGSRSRLHDQMPLRDDGVGDELGHLLLAGSILGIRKC